MNLKAEELTLRIADEAPVALKKYIDHSMNVLYRIHAVLEQKGLSQSDLAKRMQMTDTELADLINGVQDFKLSELSKLEVALGEDLIRSAHDQIGLA